MSLIGINATKIVDFFVRKKSSVYMLSGILAIGGVEIISGRFIEGVIWSYLSGKNIVSGSLSEVPPIYGVIIIALATALVAFERYMVYKESTAVKSEKKIEQLSGNLIKSEEFVLNRNKIILIDGPINHLSSVDVICTSENNLLEPAKYTSSSTSGRVRNAAAEKSITGDILRDVVIEDISEWKKENNTIGKKLPLGTVVDTSSGELLKQEIKRIFHVIIVKQKVNSNEYEMPSDTLSAGVMEIFNRLDELLLDSVSIPIFGAGSAGKDIDECIKLTCDSIISALGCRTGKFVYISTCQEDAHRKAVEYIRNATV